MTNEAEMADCGRCGDSVEEETLTRLGDTKMCEICWDDL